MKQQLLFLIFACLCIYGVICAEMMGSFEVIRLGGNSASQNNLAYVANFKIGNDTASNRTLYFTATRGVNNIYSAQFTPGQLGPDWFSCTKQSIFSSNVPGYMVFDIQGPNVVGTAFTLPPYGVQDALTTTSSYMQSVTNQGLQFTSAAVDIISPGIADVYFTAWADTFIIARKRITLGITNDLTITEQDKIRINMKGCYDQYDERQHPSLVLKLPYMFVFNTRKCAFFARIDTTSSPNNFNGSLIDTFDPSYNGTKYVSSAVLDIPTGNIYHTVKEYNAPTVLRLYTMDGNSWGFERYLMDVEDLLSDTDVKMLIARQEENEGNRYLVLIGSETNKIVRWQCNTQPLSNKGMAVIPDNLNLISTVAYYDPYIYIGTYEADAKLARLHMNNFCTEYCTVNGFCDNGACTCNAGYVKGPGVCAMAPTTNIVREETGLAIALSFFVITTVVFGFLWFRARKMVYTSVA